MRHRVVRGHARQSQGPRININTANLLRVLCNVHVRMPVHDALCTKKWHYLSHTVEHGNHNREISTIDTRGVTHKPCQENMPDNIEIQQCIALCQMNTNHRDTTQVSSNSLRFHSTHTTQHGINNHEANICCQHMTPRDSTGTTCIINRPQLIHRPTLTTCCVGSPASTVPIPTSNIRLPAARNQRSDCHMPLPTSNFQGQHQKTCDHFTMWKLDVVTWTFKC